MSKRRDNNERDRRPATSVSNNGNGGGNDGGNWQ